MRNKLITFIKKQRTDPLSKKEANFLWQAVARDLGFTDRSVVEVTSQPYFTLWYRPAFAFAMGLLLVFTGSYTAQAANDSVPGDLLYPLDITMENARLALTPKEKRGGLYYRYAMERVDELSKYTASEVMTDEKTGIYEGDTEQLRLRQSYVESYLADVFDELSPTDRERVGQHFSTVLKPTETGVQEREQKMLVPNAVEINTSETQREIRQGQQIEPMRSGSVSDYSQLQSQTNGESRQINETTQTTQMRNDTEESNNEETQQRDKNSIEQSSADTGGSDKGESSGGSDRSNSSSGGSGNGSNGPSGKQ